RWVNGAGGRVPCELIGLGVAPHETSDDVAVGRQPGRECRADQTARPRHEDAHLHRVRLLKVPCVQVLRLALPEADTLRDHIAAKGRIVDNNVEDSAFAPPAPQAAPPTGPPLLPPPMPFGQPPTLPSLAPAT